MSPVALETKIISCQIPEGILIRKCSYGYGLFASKSFKKGEVLYKGSYVLIGDEEEEYLLETSQGDFPLHTKTNGVWISPGVRAFYTFDSYMNHSCDANSCSRMDPRRLGKQEYWQVAIKDIQPGDEITCDYALFDYDCEGHPIQKCECGSDQCRGVILGFKHLSLEEQLRHLPHEDPRLFEQFLKDHPEIVYVANLRIPPHVEIVQEGGEYKLISKKGYQPGELIFENQTHHFPRELQILVQVNGEFILLDNDRHMVNREEGKQEFFYFDTFMNHSCDPNASTQYVAADRYQTRALKAIAVGEELTCDYETFSMGIGFKCYCGSAKCRGIVYQGS